MPEGYTLAPLGPTSESHYGPKAFQFLDWVPRQARSRARKLITLLTSCGFLFALFLFWHWGDWGLFSYSGEPASPVDVENFDDVFLQEARLPPHDLSAPYPEGNEGRFVLFSNEVWQLG